MSKQPVASPLTRPTRLIDINEIASLKFVDAGGLMSYGISLAERWRSAARYVDKILKGTPAGELPIEQPTRFELVVNRKTAALLGVALPASLLARADGVVE